MYKRLLTLFMTGALIFSLCACSSGSSTSDADTSSEAEESTDETETEEIEVDKTSAMLEIEEALNLANMDPEWTYSDSADAWTLSIVTAVTEPEIEDEQGVSVCVPGAYVKGIDTDGDGEADETSGTVTGNLVIDYDASVTSTNGQTYTAATAPVIINTGAAGYSRHIEGSKAR